jgi:ElaB/YqjD/DUF883 family membrane-anchored ribosome-binding protein
MRGKNMTEINVELDNLERLIDQKADEKNQINSRVKRAAPAKIIQALKEAEKEILQKHKEAKKLWKQSIDLYADFIKKNPGSKQVNPPSDMPEEPKQLDEIRGYIKVFESLMDDEIYIEFNVLREIFKTTAEGIIEARHSLYALSSAVSGLCVNYNQ